MEIAILHNFVEHPGGGDFVMLNILEALTSKGYEVSLITSKNMDYRAITNYFGKDPRIFEKIDIQNEKIPEIIRHPYNMYFLIKKTFKKLKKPELVITSDDIPKSIVNSDSRVFVYVHYPHAARIKLNTLVPYRYYNNTVGKIIWNFHKKLFKKFFLLNWKNERIYAVANSTLTYYHLKKVTQPRHLAIIYPPVQVEKIREKANRINKKRNMIVYIGRIQPEKGILDIIKASAKLKHMDFEIKIMGFLYDYKYLIQLEKHIKKLNLNSKIEILPNISREKMISILIEARVIIHPSYHEPFGISVVEGMAAGCIPVVKKGFSGPWIDIIEQGTYGYGFSSVEELSRILEKLLNNNKEISQKKVIRRALTFNEEIFKEKIASKIDELVLK